jgi:hypothetical protein
VRSGAPGAGRRAAPRLVAVAVAAAACACSGAPEPIHVREVRLVGGAAFAALGETGVDGAGVEDAVRTALAGAGFRMGSGGRPHVAGVDVPSIRVVPGGAAGPRAEVSVEVILTPAAAANTPPRHEVGIAAVPLSSAAGPRDAWRRAVAEAAQRAADGLAVGVRAEGKRVDGLVSDLSSKDARVREQAIRVLGERHAREAVPALLAQLDREDARLAHRIVGALAQIGDHRAVPALIELARGGDPTLTTRLVRFIGDIGGPEAQGYLLTVASGHPDERVRQAAREALDDLEARTKDAPVAARK